MTFTDGVLFAPLVGTMMMQVWPASNLASVVGRAITAGQGSSNSNTIILVCICVMHIPVHNLPESRTRI